MNGLQITIITSTYNCEEDFCKTAESIKNQNYCNIQWIVIDGNSNKSTLEYIYRYIDIIDYFLCESDQGIYDAWR
ncbi:glycosyltransferase [Escherichia coli]|nr:glycosyltransferase [Escherichia coli]